MKIVLVTFTADFEAHGIFGFETGGANAHKFCRLCDFDKSAGAQAYRMRTDFLATPSRRRPRDENDTPWRERSAAEVERQMAQLSLLTTQARKIEFSTQTGIFKPTSPLHSAVIPGFDTVSFRQQDTMHLEGCGIALGDASDIVHRVAKVLKACTLDALNARLARSVPCMCACGGPHARRAGSMRARRACSVCGDPHSIRSPPRATPACLPACAVRAG